MIISVSGAQGQGKTATLAKAYLLGHTVLPNQTARGILKDWHMSLDDVYNDKLLTVKFHEQVLLRHRALCDPHANTADIVLIERSYADIFSYALALLGPFNEYSDWLNDFYDRCRDAQANFTATVYLTGREYIPESDSVRSTNRHFCNIVDLAINKHLKEFEEYTNSRVFIINATNLDDRAVQLTEICKIFEEN